MFYSLKMHQNNKKKYIKNCPSILRQTFLYVPSPCMNVLKVHILNPNKSNAWFFCKIHGLTVQNIVESKCDMSLYPSKFKHRSIGPKIKFYLFAIAYLPTLFPYSTFFSCFSRSNFFFFFFFFFFSFLFLFCCFNISFQFQSEILTLYKLTRKKPTGIAFIPHFLSLFVLWWLPYLFTFQRRRGNVIQSNYM